MKVSVRCFANLTKEDICDYRQETDYELPQGAIVNDLVDTLGFDREDIKLIFVNHKSSDPKTPLQEGDKIAFAPATGGM